MRKLADKTKARKRMRADLTIVISTLVETDVDNNLFPPKILHRSPYTLRAVPWSVTPMDILHRGRAGALTRAKPFTVVMEI